MKKAISLLVFLFCIYSVFSSDFERFVLDNNLEIYSIQDNTSPIAKVYYLTQAGFNKQSQEDTGLFELYSKIFWSTNKNLQSDIANLFLTDIESICNADESLFSFSVPSDNLEKSLIMLSNQLQNPELNDSIILQEYESLKDKINTFEKSPEGFINSAIDSRIFYKAPWKHDTGIYPSKFKNLKKAKLKSLILAIQQGYYVPNNSAIVIVSPFSHDEIISLCKTLFSSWPQQQVPSDYSLNNTPNISSTKKFILLSEDFSKDLTQIIVQYPSQELYSTAKQITAAQMACLALENDNSSFKQNTEKNKNLGILAKEYTNAAFSYQGTNSRIIVQALMQNTNTSPIKQAEIFLDILKNSTKFTTDDCVNALRTFSGQSKLADDSTFQFAKALAYNWVYERNNFTKNLQFLAQSVTKDDMSQYFSIKPYIFLLLHPKTFNQNKKEIESNGYELITSENAAWYKQAEKYQTSTTAVELTSNDDIYTRIIKRIQENSGSFSLNNKINVNYSFNTENSTSTILMLFNEGELKHQNNYRGMQTILLKSLARLIQNELSIAYSSGALFDKGNVIAQSGMNYGFISISCTSSDFPVFLQCITKALFFSDITPAMEDELVYMEKSKWRYLNNLLDYQLNCKALSSFYKGYDFENLFSCTTDILSKVSFNEIKARYLGLLNSSKISLIITGNPSTTDKNMLQQLMENTFGLLKPLPFEKKALPPIQFTEMTQISRLKRIFTSDIKAEDAGPRPEHLVPTTEFLDPAIVFLQCPKIDDPNYADFVYLSNALCLSMNNDFFSSSKYPAKKVELLQINEINGICAFQFTDVKSIKELYKYFYIKCTKINAIPSDEELNKVKTYWITNQFNQIKTNDFLAMKIATNLQTSDNPLIHISLFDKINHLSVMQLPETKTNYFSNPKLYWIFSADTPK